MHADRHVQGPSDEGLLAERSFESRPESVSIARRWAGAVCSTVDGADVHLCELLVSEVATNAVRHAEGLSFQVRIFYPSLRLEIWDGSHRLPERRVATEGSVSGRGLEILELLAPGYRVVLGSEGKGICFQPKGW
ncbi:ATP-binding protein [Streptomyces sp. NPDC088261]|uniref:ATP-binding protein n=1 Tax=Streptomyces sp. NPDC088261 TaxID=3365851 RepID=UPI00381E174A